MVPDAAHVAGHIRRDMVDRLPVWLQPFLTWLTGRHDRSLPPERRRGALFRLATALATLAAGVGLGATALDDLAISALIPVYLFMLWWAWILTIGGARNLQVNVLHHLVHANPGANPGKLSRRAFSDPGRRLIYETISLILLVEPFDSYYHGHVIVHHADTADDGDPDGLLVDDFGFRRGMTTSALWRHFFVTLANPWFHFRFLVRRIRSNLSKRGGRRLCALYLALLLFIAGAGAFATIFIVWIVPLTIGVQTSSLAQFASRHLWFSGSVPQGAGARKKHLANLTVGRFCADPLPPRATLGMRWFIRWAVWWVRLMLYHLPVRIAILPGDLPDHDWHHARPRGDWPNSRAARLQYMADGHPEWPLTEVWGIGCALDRVFRHLANLPSHSIPNTKAKETEYGLR